MLAALLLAGCSEPSRQPTPAAPASMVAAANPIAVEAGLAVLKRGGSAVDAAVAVQMVLGVVEPHASGIGGGGFLLFYDASSKAITVYDGRETAPAGATPTMFLDREGKSIPFPDAIASGMSVGVPGALRLLETAHNEHGKRPWAELFDPAIALARDGFVVPPRLAGWLAALPSLAKEPAMRQLYFHADGSPRKAGDRVANPALAETMQLVATQGTRLFYEGAIAREMVARVRGHVRPGTLAMADLAGYQPIKREAVCGPYRVWIVCGMPAPSSGGVAILQALAMLEPFELSREAPNSPRAIHLIAEASRLAFADRVRYLADPAYVAVPTAGLLSADYLAERRKLISPARAMGPARPGNPPRLPVPAQAFADGGGYIEQGTSHMAIVDRDGNAVTFTTTIEAPFGAQMMVRGFVLNNELTDFTAQPVIDGRLVANAVEPGKRPRSSMSPTFVLDRDRRLVAAVGSAGGARIIGDTLQTLIGILDWNLPIQDAIDLPRLTMLGGPVEIEDRVPLAGLAEGLRAMGHEVQVRRHEGGLAGISRAGISRAGSGWQGGADKRRDGIAKGD